MGQQHYKAKLAHPCSFFQIFCHINFVPDLNCLALVTFNSFGSSCPNDLHFSVVFTTFFPCQTIVKSAAKKLFVQVKEKRLMVLNARWTDLWHDQIFESQWPVTAEVKLLSRGNQEHKLSLLKSFFKLFSSLQCNVSK